MLWYAILGYAMLCYVVLCSAMLCYAMLCYAMLCFAVRCCAIGRVWVPSLFRASVGRIPIQNFNIGCCCAPCQWKHQLRVGSTDHAARPKPLRSRRRGRRFQKQQHCHKFNQSGYGLLATSGQTTDNKNGVALEPRINLD